MATAVKTISEAALRDEWLQSVESLRNQIAEWTHQEPDWNFKPVREEDREDPPGKDAGAVWSLTTPEGEVRLELMRTDVLGRRIVQLKIDAVRNYRNSIAHRSRSSALFVSFRDAVSALNTLLARLPDPLR